MRRLFPLVLLPGLAAAPGAHAQTAQGQTTPGQTAPSPAAAPAPADPTVASALPEIVVRAPRPVSEAAERSPTAVTVIDRQTLDERGYRTLSEALAAVPGVRIVQSGAIGQPASAFLRGTNSRHVLVLLDGVPVNDAAEPNGAFNFGNDLLGPEVERIEVLRGPASSLYGSGAIGGVVNIVTRRAPQGTAFAPFGEVAAGTQRSLRLGGGAAGTVGAFDYLAAANSLSTRAFDATPRRFDRDTRERDGFRGADSTVRLGWNPAGTARVEGLFRWRENHFGLDSVPEDDADYSGEDRRYTGQLRAEATLFGVWTTGLRVAHTADRRRYLDLADEASPAATDDLYRGERTVYDFGNQVRTPDLGPLGASVVSFGFTAEREAVRQRSGGAFFRTTVDADAWSRALYGAWQVRAFERLDLSAGVRNDDSDDYRAQATWRAGAVLHVPELSSRVNLAAGTGFKAPSLYQRFGRIGSFFRGNPALRPETSTSYEAGVETDLALFGRADFATLGGTYFHTRLRDLINFDAAFASLENVDRARIRGGEVSLTLRPADWLSGTAAWTVTDARDRATGERLARRPEHVLAVNLRIAPAPGITLSPEVLFTGRSPEGAFASYRNDGSSHTTVRYNKTGTIVNLTAAWQASRAVAVFVEGRNLGDSRYEPANGFATPGRSVLVGTRFAL